ncbi:MAG: sporulation protein YunB [Acutalibacteraceae bacterium]|nr:sporulation protein YunB [Acutalibacteraceae bacterium]
MLRKRYKRQSIAWRLILISILGLILTAYFVFESYIEQSILDITRVKAEELCNDAVNTAVLGVLEDNNFNYTDFATVVFNEQAVTNISTNSVTTNKFKSLVAIRAQDEIDNMSGTEINYKLGDFSSMSLLSGRGPDLVIKLYLTSSVTTDIISSFEACGINQTKHTLSIEVISKVYITSNAEEETYTTVVTTIPITENIIVGSTPSLYIN